MRSRKPSTTNGIVDQRLHLSREVLVLGLLALVLIWMLGSLAQELYLDQKLNHQISDLREKNAQLRAANESYQRDIAASTAGAAAEEEARQNGYARPDERVYLVGSPSPEPRPTPAPASTNGPGIPGPWSWLARLPHFSRPGRG